MVASMAKRYVRRLAKAGDTIIIHRVKNGDGMYMIGQTMIVSNNSGSDVFCQIPDPRLTADEGAIVMMYVPNSEYWVVENE